MRFQAHERLLDLLVGSNLYPEPAVCVRELVQNAWDAIRWRAETQGSELEPEILVRYSQSGRWFEVADNGVGMDEHAIQESLLQIGQSKLNALAPDRPPDEQVAFFGIGILSVFLVSESVEISTRTENGPPLALTITDLHGEIASREGEREDVGTSVRVAVKPEISFEPAAVPGAVANYARHVEGITIVDVDQAESSTVTDCWATDGLISVESVQPTETIRGGRLGFAEGLMAEGQILTNRLTLANAGFLAESGTHDLLPLPPVGFSGELDLRPGALNIVMARERFQRDELWQQLGATLVGEFERRALRELESGILASGNGLDESRVRRALILWSWTLAQVEGLDELKARVTERLVTTVPFALAEQRSASLEEILRRSVEPRLYVRRLGVPAQQTRHIDDEGMPVQFVEEVRDSIRVGALRAKGFLVVEVEQIAVTQETAGGAVSQRIEEYAVLAHVLASRAVELLEVQHAPEEDMDLEGIERLTALRHLIDVGGEMRFARVPDSHRRLVTDPSGKRYLNVNSAAMRELLAVVPAAVSNPLRRRLLEVYLHVESLGSGSV